MKIKCFLVLSCIFFNSCFAGKYVQPTKYEYQEEYLIQGAPVIVSKKTNSVLIYQTCEDFGGSKCNFYFAITNNTYVPFNFYVSNLKVTDQWGQPIRIVGKSEQISKKERKRFWAHVLSGMAGGLASMNAQNAGNINYQTQTYGSYNANYNSYNSCNGFTSGSIYGSGYTTTTGTIQSEYLRQQAQRQVDMDTAQRGNSINMKYDRAKSEVDNFYIDDNTIFPDQLYGANFQIEVSANVEKTLEYLLFTFEIDGEEHIFCFYCH